MKQTITVQELIDELRKYPRDMPVLATWENLTIPFRVESFEVVEGTLIIDVDQY